MSASVYRIRNWDEHFETAESRKYKSLKWVAFPNKHDGIGYRRLIRAENGPAMYGAWCLLVQVASKCDPRGALMNDGQAMTAEDVAVKTDCPSHLITATIKFCLGLRWIEEVNLTESSGTPGDRGEKLLIPDITGPDKTKPGTGDFSNPSSGNTNHKSGKKPRRSSIFAKLTLEDLRNDAILSDWVRAAAARAEPVVGSSERDLLNVFGAAEHALKPGRAKKNPVAMFADIVRNGRWSVITQSEEDCANKRIKRFCSHSEKQLVGR